MFIVSKVQKGNPILSKSLRSDSQLSFPLWSHLYLCKGLTVKNVHDLHALCMAVYHRINCKQWRIKLLGHACIKKIHTGVTLLMQLHQHSLPL